MSTNLSKIQQAEIVSSLQRYAAKELDCELGDVQAGLFLDYILQEIGPFAYNQGVEDAKTFLAAKMEDLSGTCFEEGLTYWHKPAAGTRTVRRKP
ncbi:MAG: DUF2164 domain-containing protein [Prosthecobacter sp.]|nr:DUF2164 domain-containing protein [Prosthecobacter sp.]